MLRIIQKTTFWAITAAAMIVAVGLIFQSNYALHQETKSVFADIAQGVIRPEWLRVDTSAWKMYENKKFGFRFKYPLELRVFPCYGQMLFCLNVGEKNQPFQDNGFGVRIYDVARLNSLDETGFVELQMNGVVWRFKRDSVRAFRSDFAGNVQMRVFATSSYARLDSIIGTFGFIK